MSEMRARANRRAFCFGSCTMNGFTGRSGPVLRLPDVLTPAPAAGGAGGAGRAGGGAGAGGAGGGGAAAARAAAGMAGRAGAAGRAIGEAAGATGDAGGAGRLGGAAGRAIAGRDGGGAAIDGAGAGAARGGAAGGGGAARGGGATGAAAPAPSGLTAKTLLQTVQRARRPPAGTLAGFTRYTVSHDGQVTFTLYASLSPLSSPPSRSWRRSTTKTDPACVFA